MNNHPADSLKGDLPLVFTALSAENAYLKEKICAYVLGFNAVPVNPFMALGYFLYDMVDKDSIRRANNSLLLRCDELWVFGTISDGVQVEVELAKAAGIPTRFLNINHHGTEIHGTEVHHKREGAWGGGSQ